MENFEAGQSHGQETAPEAPKKPRFWKFAAWFVGIVVIVLAAASLASYVSPEARRDRELQRNYLQYQKGMSEFEAAMRADTYGGKTPQETLDMFVDALKKGDVELASKYFVLKNGIPDENWRNALEKAGKENRLSVITDDIGRARQTSLSSELKTAWFAVFSEKGEIVHEILLKLNEVSGVWKIESL